MEKIRLLPKYITILFIICIVTLIGNAFSNYQNMRKLKNENDWMDHTWTVKDHLKNVNLLIMDAENSLRGYYLSGDEIFLGPQKTALADLGEEFKLLEKLTKDNPNQVKNLTQLRMLFDRKLQKFSQEIEIYKTGGLAEVVKIIQTDEGKSIMDEIRLMDVIMEKEELELLNNRRTLFYEQHHHALWIGNMINAIAVLVLMLFYRLIQDSFVKQGKAEAALQQTNDNLEAIVSTRTKQLSVLSRHLLSVSEEEKAKLARELHDEMGASLTAINMDISMLADKLHSIEPELLAQLHRVKTTLLQVVDFKRKIIENLRPSMLDTLGLSMSLQTYSEEVARIAGLKLATEIDEDIVLKDPSWSIALFRIAQESLTNVIKYSRATHVKVSLKNNPSELCLKIEDDGIGIPADAITTTRSYGLLGMRERTLLLGGVFSAARGQGNKGTVIEARFPR
ncbi:CHASE3 domain-containing protein [Undibacterium sp. Jales W-56]|uniref:CHASE3 domain-containing protein n=1 Tax=Undibacterium sp. Jales W-56 TaxID=2897325 RepID=UPI0021CEAE5E|nr:CHASE3 domain-containing protein [Undibacterium sp. Jales W-56]MCU6434893.1 CHASE3 domain-containing protein [Undibacterium sp. Jales W-56]